MTAHRMKLIGEADKTALEKKTARGREIATHGLQSPAMLAKSRRIPSMDQRWIRVHGS